MSNKSTLGQLNLFQTLPPYSLDRVVTGLGKVVRHWGCIACWASFGAPFDTER